MKRRIHFYNLKQLFAVTIAAMVFYTNTIVAQNPYVTECPYFNVIIPDTVGVAFPLISTNVNATISGVIASVEVEQVYENAGDQIVDATYVFPMSTNAAVYSMQMVLDGRVIDAEIKEKAEAQQIFNEANESGQTASLLDQERPNVFQMSLANIQPGSVLQVRMKYTELIEPEKGIYQFVFPNVVGPRFTNGTEEWVFQSINNSTLLANTDLNIDLTINAGMEVTARCLSHNTQNTNDGETANFYIETNPGDDFVVDYSLEGNQIETGMLLYEGEEENFFLTMIQPPKSDIAYDSPPREYVFIMDVSGSMRGEPIEISKDMITNLLNDLNDDDRFNIILFASSNSVLSPNSLPVTPQNMENAFELIDNQQGGGSTQLLPAMQTALSMQGTEGYSRTFVILTDGYITVEKEAYEMVRQNLNEANFFSFGIGSRVNRYIIEGLAYVGEGEAFVVDNCRDAYSTANTFKEYIERPALTNIRTEISGINVYDVEPLSVPDVFADRPIIIYGKYDDASSGSITLSGDHADSQIFKTLNFADYQANAEENIALKYLWARKKIQLVSDYGIITNGNSAESIEEEITALGLQYNLVTDYTSFVAVDTAAVAGLNETTTPVDSNDSFGGYAPSPPPQAGAPPAPGAPGGTPGAPGISGAPGYFGPSVPGGSLGLPCPKPEVFTDYPWVSSFANPDNCAGEKITVYSAGSYNFVLVQSGNESKLYFENGTFYCKETPGYSCLDAYNLTSEVISWTCENAAASAPPAPINGCTDANAINYNASATSDDGSCQYQNTAVPVFATYPWLSTYVNQSNCNGENITVYNAGSYSFVLIQDGSEGKLYFENGTYYCDETPTRSCVAAYGLNNIAQTWACGTNTPATPNPAPTISGCTNANATNYNSAATTDDGSCQYQNSNATVFSTYPWISTYVNANNCNGESVTVYDAGSYSFVLIQDGNEGKLYFENGTFYCNETVARSCVAAYGLNNIAQTWSCGNNNTPIDNTPNCSKYTGTFFYQNCGGNNYYFIRLEDGSVFDPYFEEGISVTPLEGQQIRFDYVINTGVTTPCSVSQNPITITCFEDISVAGCTNSTAINFNTLATVDDGSCQYENTSTCNTNTGRFFYQNCGGVNYYFIRLEDGRVFDPYFAPGIGITPLEGQQIQFDYVIKTDITTPCTVSESPITITCFEEIKGTVFEEYSWLSAEVNENNCRNESVTVYDAGSYNFVYVQTPTGNSLYYQDGTFYCSDAPGYSCLAAYSLINVDNSWSCGGIQNNKQIENSSEASLEKGLFNIYPNPTRDVVFIETQNQQNEDFEVLLFDISGKQFELSNKTFKQTETLLRLDVDHLPKGIYMVQLQSESQTHIEKLIVE